MELNEILQQSTGVFRRVFENDSIVINDQTVAQDVAEWDSLSHTLMISEIEKHFGVRFKFKEVIAFKNVGDMLNTIQAKLAEQGK
jgi:acyl carrier protein